MTEIVILDLETTGVNDGVKLDEPVQIGIIDGVGKALLNTLVKPRVEIDPEASAVHGITLDQLTDAPTFTQLLPDILSIIGDKTVLGYNIGFDYRVMITAAFNAGVLFPPFKVQDVMRPYTQLWNPDGYHQKLTAALEQQGLGLENAHDAISDCQMTLRLYQHLCDENAAKRKFNDGKPLSVMIAAIEKKAVATGKNKGAAYLRLHTAGGQQINLFDSSFYRLTNQGYPLQAWLNKLTDDVEQPLTRRIAVDMIYGSTGYPEIAAVTSKFEYEAAS